ncbi:hypothetical protein DS565_00975 [Salmonella enterica subsp. enterica serovar Bareilly]|nr:hypothetical protein [Salmonella enterica subsp. enterica serovar Bareilly]
MFTGKAAVSPLAQVHGLSVSVKGTPKPSYHHKNECQVKNFNDDDLKGELFSKHRFIKNKMLII